MEFNYLPRGWTKTQLMLNSTQVEVVDVVELGKNAKYMPQIGMCTAMCYFSGLHLFLNPKDLLHLLILGDETIVHGLNPWQSYKDGAQNFRALENLRYKPI